jgi:hypothetical protein
MALTLPVPDGLVEAIAQRAAEIVLARLAEDHRSEHTPRYLTVKQAASHFSMSEAALRHAIARGQIAGVVQEDVGHRIRIDRRELDRSIAAR